MTEASTGLRQALLRSSSIAGMSATDILASISDEQKAELSASFAASAPAIAADPESDPKEAEPDGDPDDGKCAKCGDPMKDGKCAKCAGDASASAEEAKPLLGNASVHERTKAVAAAVASDENCKGKASLALALLADDEFTTLSANGIIKMLGATTTTALAEDDGGKAMLAAMISAGNPNLGNADEEAAPAAQANHGWNDIHADIQARRRA